MCPDLHPAGDPSPQPSCNGAPHFTPQTGRPPQCGHLRSRLPHRRAQRRTPDDPLSLAESGFPHSYTRGRGDITPTSRVLRTEGDVRARLALSGHAAFSPPLLPMASAFPSSAASVTAVAALLRAAWSAGLSAGLRAQPHCRLATRTRTRCPRAEGTSPTQVALLAAGWSPHRHVVLRRTWHLPLGLFWKDPSSATLPPPLCPSP